MPAKIQIRGARETANALAAVGRQSTQISVLRAALRPAANDIKRDVQNQVSASGLVDTGLYRRSIAVRVGRRNRYGEAARVYIGVRGVRRYISHILEFGSRYVPGRPHFTPVANRALEPVTRSFGREIWPQIAKAVTRNATRVARRAVR